MPLRQAVHCSLRAFGGGIVGLVLPFLLYLPVLGLARLILGDSLGNPTPAILAGAVLVSGVVPSIYALICWTRVTYRYGTGWNPASAYLGWGAFFASLAILLDLLVAFAVAAAAA